MKILVDADACPVRVSEAISTVTAENGIPVVFITSIAHIRKESKLKDLEYVIVDNLPEAADLAIVNRTEQGDLVITQDYGLAAMVLGKKAKALSPRGLVFNDQNIALLLEQRHLNQVVRRGGGRTKGPKEFSQEDLIRFQKALARLTGF